MRALPILVVLSLLAAGARAAGAAEGIVVEAAGDGASGVPHLVLEELEMAGYLGGEELARRLQAVHSRAGTELGPKERAEARAAIRAGSEATINGDFDRAADQARRGLEALLSRPATVARHQELRDDVYLAYVTLALAEKQRGHADRSAEAMQALVRSFPGRELSYTRFGPVAREIYLAQKKALEARGTGTLRVELPEKDVMVFLDERFIGLGSVKERLYAGVHRIYLQRGERAGRVREVTVYPGREKKLALSWPLERALDLESGRVALKKEASLRGVAQVARELGRQLGVNQVVLVGERGAGGRRLLTASLLRGKDETVREAAVALEPDGTVTAARARLLATFIARGERGPGLLSLEESEAPASGKSALPGVLLGGGAAGAAAGIVLLGVGLARDCSPSSAGGSDDPRCRASFGPTEIGLTALGLGTAALAAGFYLWFRAEGEEAHERRRGAAVTVIPAPGGAQLGVSVRF